MQSWFNPSGTIGNTPRNPTQSWRNPSHYIRETRHNSGETIGTTPNEPGQCPVGTFGTAVGESRHDRDRTLGTAPEERPRPGPILTNAGATPVVRLRTTEDTPKQQSS